MTAIVGILCKDGVVIGADSSATLGPRPGQPTIELPINKIDILHNEVIIVGTGEIGLGQRFRAFVENHWSTIRHNHKTPIDVAKALSAGGIQDFASTHIQRIGYGALVAYPFDGKPQLCELALDTFQPEMREYHQEKLWYGSMGATVAITDSFLALVSHVFWQDELPNIHDGIFAVTWTLDHAVRVNAGGVNKPVRVAILEPDPNQKKKCKARQLEEHDLAEHRMNIADAERALRDYKKHHMSNSTAEAPTLPEAPPSN